jgi:hypothetical protein
LLVKVQINFGPPIPGPDNGTLIITANPGDFLRIRLQPKAQKLDNRIVYPFSKPSSTALEGDP